ncbi:hypothetical protein GJ496_008584 [Pomphorhynchus laevis]|nr:hypothetical protein GJ496_008584 [Pomphorhynchus laevis]
MSLSQDVNDHQSSTQTVEEIMSQKDLIDSTNVLASSLVKVINDELSFRIERLCVSVRSRRVKTCKEFGTQCNLDSGFCHIEEISTEDDCSSIFTAPDCLYGLSDADQNRRQLAFLKSNHICLYGVSLGQGKVCLNWYTPSILNASATIEQSSDKDTTFTIMLCSVEKSDTWHVIKRLRKVRQPVKVILAGLEPDRLYMFSVLKNDFNDLNRRFSQPILLCVL